MKRLNQSGSSNFCPKLRKNALLISQSYFSNFALHVIKQKNSTFNHEIQHSTQKLELYKRAKRRARIIPIIRALEGRNVWNTCGMTFPKG